jgi:hypothetical protein
MSFLLSRLNSVTRRYLPLPSDESDDSQGNDNASIYLRIQQYLRAKLGPCFPVVVFLLMLSAIVLFAIVTNEKNSPIRNLNDILLNYNYSQAQTHHIATGNSSDIFEPYRPRNRLHGPTGVYNSTIIGKHHNDGAAEIGQ